MCVCVCLKANLYILKGTIDSQHAKLWLKLFSLPGILFIHIVHLGKDFFKVHLKGLTGGIVEWDLGSEHLGLIAVFSLLSVKC